MALDVNSIEPSSFKSLSKNNFARQLSIIVIDIARSLAEDGMFRFRISKHENFRSLGTITEYFFLLREIIILMYLTIF